MNHPYEQLADLVDGTLDEETLAGVQAHLRTCASCREDLANATAGRAAARSLPQEPAPADLHERVAGGRRRPRSRGARLVPVGPAAAAAALVSRIALALPDVGDETADMRAGAPRPPRPPRTPRPERSRPARSSSRPDRDYDEAALRDRAQTAGDRATLDAPAAATTAAKRRGTRPPRSDV